MSNRYLVVLVNYNNWNDTSECIDSLLSANVSPESIIVIENGSLNDSVERLKEKFPQMLIKELRDNLGFSGGNNIGIKHALDEGFEYIILLNNDTIVSENALNTLINNMDVHQEASVGTGQIRCLPAEELIWYAGGYLIPWRGLAVHRGYGKKYTDFVSDKIYYPDFVSGCYLCIRASDIDKLGYLNEAFFLYLEDIEFSARAVKNGLKLIYIPDSVIYHKWRGETKLRKNSLYYAVRNRMLLIDLVFPKSAKTYFRLVITLKLIFWFFNNRVLYNSARKGLEDYKNNYFGPVRA